MFETAADNSSILSIDLGIMLGMFVVARLLDPSSMWDRILFGSTTGWMLVIYACGVGMTHFRHLHFRCKHLWQYFFFAFEALAISYTLMSIVILFRSIDRSAQADLAQHRMEARGVSRRSMFSFVPMTNRSRFWKRRF